MPHLFAHNGIAFAPDGSQGEMSPEAIEAHNRAQDAVDVAYAQTLPDRLTAYYTFPAEQHPLFGGPKVWRASFAPLLHSYIENGVANEATVTTWQGSKLGSIVSAHVYSHNFGGRFVSIRARINGATYYGRASWDNGSVINLRKAKV